MREFSIKLIILKTPYNVTLPNGKIIEVNYSGTIIFTSNLILRSVFFRPTFHLNLIFVTQLVQSYQGNLIFTFLHTLSIALQAPSMKRPQVLGKIHNGLYFLQASPKHDHAPRKFHEYATSIICTGKMFTLFISSC